MANEVLYALAATWPHWGANAGCAGGGLPVTCHRCQLEALAEKLQATERSMLELAAKHWPMPSDLVGWYCRCSCATEMPVDCETEDDWIEHVISKWKRGQE